jgi:hypothetical protein
MEFTDQYYAIVGQVAGYSKRDGSPLSTITMWGVDDGQTYHTYIVKHYKNSVNWDYITRNPTQGFLVKFANGTLKRELQVSGDSIPIIQDQLATTFELKRICQQIWTERDPHRQRRVKPTQAEVLAQAEKFVQMARDLFDTAE